MSNFDHNPSLARRLTEMQAASSSPATVLLKSALLQLQVEGPTLLKAGICGNVEAILDRREGLTAEQLQADQAIVAHLIFELVEIWPARRAQSRVMPIPGYLTNSEAQTLWVGEQLTERQALITYMLDCLNSDQGATS